MSLMSLVVSVPSVSFSVYAPGFFARFIESHAVMFQGNAGLKPKEGEDTSRPWQWPINYRVCARVNTLVYKTKTGTVTCGCYYLWNIALRVVIFCFESKRHQLKQ